MAQLGVTQAIDYVGPDAQDHELTRQIVKILDRESPLESEEGQKKRLEVLRELEEILQDFVYEQGVAHGLGEAAARAAGGKVFTFGSYRLGMISPGSDIDCLLLCPRHISREAFFEILIPKLQDHPDVRDVTGVQDAYTPIIKLYLKDIDLDLLVASLDVASIPPDYSLKDDKIMLMLDEAGMRSVNGTRVNDAVLNLVPNVEAFRIVLRFIKLWAQRRGLYSNKLGYFGGITWALLTCRVCQLWPNAAASQLIHRFFKLFNRWQWPNPVMLTEMKDLTLDGFDMSRFKQWNPNLDHHDAAHLMPILTPAFPCMNSTHNVSETTKRVLCQEIGRGWEMVNAIQGSDEAAWERLLEPLPFFEKLKYFLQIEVVAKNEVVFQSWKGWVEARLRNLVQGGRGWGNGLEGIAGVQCIPWPGHVEIENSTNEDWPYQLNMYIGLGMDKDTKNQISGELKGSINAFVDAITKRWSDAAANQGQFNVMARLKPRKNLPPEVHGDKVPEARQSIASAAPAVTGGKVDDVRRLVEDHGCIVRNDDYLKKVLDAAAGDANDAAKMFWDWYRGGIVPHNHIEYTSGPAIRDPDAEAKASSSTSAAAPAAPAMSWGGSGLMASVSSPVTEKKNLKRARSESPTRNSDKAAETPHYQPPKAMSDVDMGKSPRRSSDGGKAKRLGFLISQLPFEDQRALLGPPRKKKRIRIKLEE